MVVTKRSPATERRATLKPRSALLDGALFSDSTTSRPKWSHRHASNHNQRGSLEEVRTSATGESSTPLARSCVRDTGNTSAKFSNLASTGMKPVGGRKNSGAVRVVVGKPGFHRHEAGWGTLDSVQQTIRSGIQIFNFSDSIKTRLRIPHFRRTGQIAPL